MTIDKRASIAIPVPLLSVIMSVIAASLIVWGAISAGRVKQDMNDTKFKEQDIKIETIRKEKADKEMMQMVVDRLDEINRKLSAHMEKN